MDKSPHEKSAYREMLTKNLGEEGETFKFQTTKDLVSTGSDEEREEDEKEITPDNIQSKSFGAQVQDLANYKTLFYTLLIAVIGWMFVSLYNQNGDIGAINGNITGIKGDIGRLESDVDSIKEKYEDNIFLQKDFDYIKGRLNFIESKLPF